MGEGKGGKALDWGQQHRPQSGGVGSVGWGEGGGGTQGTLGSAGLEEATVKAGVQALTHSRHPAQPLRARGSGRLSGISKGDWGRGRMGGGRRVERLGEAEAEAVRDPIHTRHFAFLRSLLLVPKLPLRALIHQSHPTQEDSEGRAHETPRFQWGKGGRAAVWEGGREVREGSVPCRRRL